MSTKICPQCGATYAADDRFCKRDGASLVSEHPDDSLVGRVIADRYDVKQKLGEGGMGEVYLAEHVRIRRKVALKIMRKWMADDHVALGRFHREAENASQISHPNVATIYDFGETGDGTVYFAMEYVDGKPLAGLLESEGRLGIVRSLDIVRQTADALSAAHHLGILHRDLKPDNVMVGKGRAGTDQVKLVDFGISRVMDRGTQQFTSTGMIVGTPDYMSPEQLSGDTMDARTDLYALALIAYRTLTGADAFGKGTPHETLMWRLTRPPRPLREVCPEVEWPEAAGALFDRALAADPAARFGDALEFAAALEQALSTVELTEADETYFTALAMRSATPPRGFGSIDGTLTPPRGHATLDAPTPKPLAALPDAVIPRTVERERAATSPPSAATEGRGVRDARDDVGEVSGVGGARARAVAAADTFARASAADTSAPVSAAGVPPSRVPSRQRVALYGAGAAALVVIALFAVRARRGLEGRAADPIAGDSPAAAVSPSARPDSDSAAAIGGATTPPTAAPNAMSPGDLVSRFGRSVFAVSSPRGRGAGFLVDPSGLVMTAASVVGPAGAAQPVDVQVDAERTYRAPVVWRDTALALLLIPARACGGCQVVPLADSTTAPHVSDTVVSIGPAQRTPSRPRATTLRGVGGARLTLETAVDQRLVGAPLLSSLGIVVGVAAPKRDLAVAAAQARAALDKARGLQRQFSADTTAYPTWPAATVVDDDRKPATDREVNDRYRAGSDAFAVLVMTPRVVAWRRDSIQAVRNADPFHIGVTYRNADEKVDPIEQWGDWDSYWNDRRAAVIIEIAPDQAPPPFHASNKRVDFRRGNFQSAVLKRDGVAVLPIKEARIRAVPDAAGYAPQQLFSSGLLVYAPAAFSSGNSFTLEVMDATRPGKAVVIPLSSKLVNAVRNDLAAYVPR